MDKYLILQSGFISAPNDKLILSTPPGVSELASAVTLNKPIRSTENDNFYHTVLDSLFNGFLKDQRLLKSFDFRKRYLTETLDAFNVANIDDWFRLQLKNPYGTLQHRKYMNEWIVYLLTSQRSFDIQSWQGILEPREISDLDKTVAVPIDDYFESKSDLPSRLKNPLSYSSPYATYPTPSLGVYSRRLPRSIEAFIADWTSKPEGFEDMINTVGIIFSKKRLLSV